MRSVHIASLASFSIEKTFELCRKTWKWDKIITRNKYHRHPPSATRLTKNKNVSINSLVWSCCLYLYVHRFTISIVRLCSVWANIMKGKGYEDVRTIKILSLKIQEATSKSVAITEKNGKQCIRQIIYINHEHLPAKFTPVFDFTNEPIIQC